MVIGFDRRGNVVVFAVSQRVVAGQGVGSDGDLGEPWVVGDGDGDRWWFTEGGVALIEDLADRSRTGRVAVDYGNPQGSLCDNESETVG